MLFQFEEWLKGRLLFGNMLFVVCFTADGNLLSQWRSYTNPSKGVSIGFAADTLVECASSQSFQLARCVYDPEEQRILAERFIEELIKLARTRGEVTDPSKRHPANSFHAVFEEIEDDLLRIASLLKDSAFHEEKEWRAVSRIITSYVTEPLEYREGQSTLIPYTKFTLPTAPGRRIDLHRVIIGPTPRGNNSVTSMSNFLSRNGASPLQGTMYCQIPYRTW